MSILTRESCPQAPRYSLFHAGRIKYQSRERIGRFRDCAAPQWIESLSLCGPPDWSSDGSKIEVRGLEEIYTLNTTLQDQSNCVESVEI